MVRDGGGRWRTVEDGEGRCRTALDAAACGLYPGLPPAYIWYRSRDADNMHMLYACCHAGGKTVSRKVRKTLNIDAAKLKRAQDYLGLDTETEVIDHLLDAVEYERKLNQLASSASPSWQDFRSPITRRGGR